MPGWGGAEPTPPTVAFSGPLGHRGSLFLEAVTLPSVCRNLHACMSKIVQCMPHVENKHVLIPLQIAPRVQVPPTKLTEGRLPMLDKFLLAPPAPPSGSSWLDPLGP